MRPGAEHPRRPENATTLLEPTFTHARDLFPGGPGSAPRPVCLAVLVVAAVGLLAVVDFVVTARAQAEWLARQTPGDLTPGLTTEGTVSAVVLGALWLVVWAVFVVKAGRGPAVNLLRSVDVIHQTPLVTAWIVVAVLEIAFAVVASVLLWREPAWSWYAAVRVPSGTGLLSTPPLGRSGARAGSQLAVGNIVCS